MKKHENDDAFEATEQTILALLQELQSESAPQPAEDAADAAAEEETQTALPPSPDGETGEIVITTLRKEGAPLIRYRTHDLSRIVPEKCACGLPYPRIDRIIGRSDDMVKVKGVNIYPGQVEDVLREVDGVSSEYQVMIDHMNGRDIMTLFFETNEGVEPLLVEKAVRDVFKLRVGLLIEPKAVALGELPRSEKKSTRIFDNRY